MSCSLPELADVLRQRAVILDGATGTELERRGVGATLPLWSAEALIRNPDVVLAVHRDYVRAGADILTANTFRTNPRTLRRAGREADGPELNRRAVELARRAVREASCQAGAGGSGGGAAGILREAGPGRRVWVAASVGPVEDCYRPERVPDREVLEAEHRQMVAWLRDAGPDLLWIETMNTVREACAAARAASEAGLPFVVCLVTREDGELLGGESLEAAVAAIEPLGPLALGLNCIPPDGLTRILPRLRSLTGRPLAAYAHINNAEPIPGWTFAQAVGPADYARYALRWRELGASIIGGCCGTTPQHIRALRSALTAGALSVGPGGA